MLLLQQQTITPQQSEVDKNVENKPNRVINLTNITIPREISQTLEKGLNFAFPNEQVKEEEILVGAIAVAERLDSNERKAFEMEVSNVILNHIPKHFRLPLCRDITTFCRNNKIRVLRADKGGSVVLMLEEEYDTKMHNMLADKKTYGKLKTDSTNKITAQLKLLLGNIVTNRKELSKFDKKWLVPTDARAPTASGLPKIHKEGIPLRLIVNNRGSPCYRVARFVCRSLSQINDHFEHTAKNSYEVVDKLDQTQLIGNETMASFDVVAMYPNIPIDKAIQALKELLENKPEILGRTKLSTRSVIEIVQFCMKSTYLKFKGNFYEQKFGCSMGSPLSPLVANVFMAALETKFLNSLVNPPLLWIRYLDDILVVIRGNITQIKDMLIKLNELDNSVKFTVELEENKSLAFLDILISRENAKFGRDLYRKSIHSGIILNFHSNHKYPMKVGILKSQIIRSFRLADKDHIDTELRRLKNIFKDNDYPEKIINRQIENVKETFQKFGQYMPPVKTDEERKTIMCLPSCALADKVSKTGKKFGIKTIFKQTTTLNSLIPNQQEKTPELNTSGVYGIPCRDCEEVYVGETGRLIKTRISEHKRATRNGEVEKSELARHTVTTGHEIDWEGTKRIAQCNSKYKRKIRESVEIKKGHKVMNTKVDEKNIGKIFSELLSLYHYRETIQTRPLKRHRPSIEETEVNNPHPKIQRNTANR